jgi:hypothetical protein
MMAHRQAIASIDSHGPHAHGLAFLRGQLEIFCFSSSDSSLSDSFLDVRREGTQQEENAYWGFADLSFRLNDAVARVQRGSGCEEQP